MRYWADRRVLVTGGTGFLGAHLVKGLIRRGARVTVLVREVNILGRLTPVRDRLTLFQGDISQAESLAGLSGTNPETVFHLAAFGVERPLESIDSAIAVNIQGTSNLISALLPVASTLSAFVYVGTDFEYGPGMGPRTENDPLAPPNYYSASKAAGWYICNAF